MSKAADTITQSEIESFMVGAGWISALEDISTINTYDTWVVTLQIVGWFLKPIPFISFFGYACDFASGLISLLKWTPKEEVFKFILDPSNYPSTSLYE